MAASGMHRPGIIARVGGLTKAPHLNGERGQLVRLTEAGRWVIDIQPGFKAIRPENLFPAADEVPTFGRRGFAAAAAITAHILLELVRSGGLQVLSVVLVPISLLVWTLLTLLGCSWLHYPLGIPEVLPTISELSIAAPARGVYRSGSATVGILLACTIRLYQTLLLSQFSQTFAEERANLTAMAGYVAAAGIAWQGLFTLPTGPKRSYQKMMHIAGWIAFICGSILHLSSDFLSSTFAASTTFRVSLALRCLLSFTCDMPAIGAGSSQLVFLFVSFIIPGCFMATQSSLAIEGTGSGGDAASAAIVPARAAFRQRIQGYLVLAQWILVFHIAIFYCTYSLDFYVALTVS
eukprot:TRINITY_DN32003_c0_g1_i1.p1 TRINITY_DN32003_c0_g1~~TRINITY_DN32003_c0_g1_i1.p1  ORF type:complete len:350 (-),score=43.79 TRINITY_DN32003_c0_g1_i1:105-1154(-)